MGSKSYIDKCWICGNPANSEEHKFKSSLLRRKFGKKYKGENQLLYFCGDDEFPVESYKSKELKLYAKIVITLLQIRMTKRMIFLSNI